MTAAPVVVDASALVELLARGPRAEAVEHAIANGPALAPDLVNLEVLSVLARLERRDEMSPERAREAATDLRDSPVRRVPTQPLLDRVWDLRGGLSVYDASYIALALEVGCPLVTADLALARAGRGTVAILTV